MINKLLNTLKEYLDKEGINYHSLKFNGLRQNVPQLNGTTRELYSVSFLCSTSNASYDGDALYGAYFDPATKQLLHIIGPQAFIKVEAERDQEDAEEVIRY